MAPSLPTIDTAELRRKLAGLADPSAMGSDGVGERTTVKEHASQLCLVLARLFNRDVLAPETLWERIGSGLATGCAKIQDGDLDAFVSLCLDHVKADLARAAADDGLAALFGVFETWPVETRAAFLRYIDLHKYAVVTHGRSRWEAYKEQTAKAPRKPKGDGR